MFLGSLRGFFFGTIRYSPFWRESNSFGNVVIYICLECSGSQSKTLDRIAIPEAQNKADL